MLFIIVFSYLIFCIFDLKATKHKQDKMQLGVYFVLMSISAAISIASIFIENMPSPAAPIKQFIFNLLGK